MTLSVYRILLPGCRILLPGCWMSFHECRISLSGCYISFLRCRIIFPGCRISRLDAVPRSLDAEFRFLDDKFRLLPGFYFLDAELRCLNAEFRCLNLSLHGHIHTTDNRVLWPKQWTQRQTVYRQHHSPADCHMFLANQCSLGVIHLQTRVNLCFRHQYCNEIYLLV